MHKPIGTRHNFHKRAKGFGAHHLAGVDAPRFSRLGQRFDALARLLGGRSLRRGNEHAPVFLNIDFCASLLLQRTNGLSTRANHRANFVFRNLDDYHPRRIRGHLCPWRIDMLCHHIQNLQPCLARLGQSLRHNLRSNARDFDIHLQCRDAGIGSGHFEIHVANMVFHALDIGQDHIIVILLDQPHCNPSHRLLQWHTSIHQRQRRSANRCHRS